MQDILLKPVKDLNRLRETVLACLYPNMFNSRVEEEERLFGDGISNPLAREAASGTSAAGAAKYLSLQSKLSPAGSG